MTERFVGLDVRGVRIQASVRPGGLQWDAPADHRGIVETTEKLQDIHPDLIVMESHGGFELFIAGVLAIAGLPFALVPSRNVREFARAICALTTDCSLLSPPDSNRTNAVSNVSRAEAS